MRKPERVDLNPRRIKEDWSGRARTLTGIGIEKGTGTFWQYRCIGTGTNTGTGIGSTITCGFHSSADKKTLLAPPSRLVTSDLRLDAHLSSPKALNMCSMPQNCLEQTERERGLNIELEAQDFRGTVHGMEVSWHSPV